MILYDNIFIWYYMIIWLWLDNVMIMIIGYYRWYIYIYLYIWRRRRDDLIYLLLSGSWCSNRSPRGRDDCHPIANCENNNGCAWRVFPLKNLQREEAEDAEAAELVDLFDGLWRFQTYDRTESVYSNIPLRQALLTPWLYPLPPFAHCLRGSQTPCK